MHDGRKTLSYFLLWKHLLKMTRKGITSEKVAKGADRTHLEDGQRQQVPGGKDAQDLKAEAFGRGREIWSGPGDRVRNIALQILHCDSLLRRVSSVSLHSSDHLSYPHFPDPTLRSHSVD